MKTRNRWSILLVVACMGYFIFGCGGGGGAAVEEGDGEETPAVVEDLCSVDVDYFEMFDCRYDDVVPGEVVDGVPDYISYETAVNLIGGMGVDGETIKAIMVCFAANECKSEPYETKIEGCISGETLTLFSDECGLTELMATLEAERENEKEEEEESEKYAICHATFSYGCDFGDSDQCEEYYTALSDENGDRKIYNCAWDEEDKYCFIYGGSDTPECTGGTIPDE